MIKKFMTAAAIVAATQAKPVMTVHATAIVIISPPNKAKSKAVRKVAEGKVVVIDVEKYTSTPIKIIRNKMNAVSETNAPFTHHHHRQ